MLGRDWRAVKAQAATDVSRISASPVPQHVSEDDGDSASEAAYCMMVDQDEA